jgi:hypothetical protein
VESTIFSNWNESAIRCKVCVANGEVVSFEVKDIIFYDGLNLFALIFSIIAIKEGCANSYKLTVVELAESSIIIMK